jgi:hypothetical protein
MYIPQWAPPAARAAGFHWKFVIGPWQLLILRAQVHMTPFYRDVRWELIPSESDIMIVFVFFSLGLYFYPGGAAAAASAAAAAIRPDRAGPNCDEPPTRQIEN